MVIYKTTNLVNGKIYVGQDTKNDNDYLGSGIILKKAILKHGVKNFKKEIIDEATNRRTLNNKEIYWINKLDSTNKKIGYNIALGGEGGDTYSENPNINLIIDKLSGKNNHFYGKTHSKESKEKISKKLKGKKAWNKGIKNPYSREHLKKISDIRKEKYSGENHPRYIDISKEILEELITTNSIRQIAKILNVSASCVQTKIKKYGIR